jgi:hypothetical protein
VLGVLGGLDSDAPAQVQAPAGPAPKPSDGAGRFMSVVLADTEDTWNESLREFMATSIALPATVVSDGLDFFTVAKEMGMAHDRTVTGGGRGSVEVEERWAVNTILGNLKTAMTGTYHAIKFAKYAHR